MRSVAIAVVVLPLFVAAALLKSTGYNVLGASPPPPVSQWVISAQAVGVGLLYYLLTLAGIGAGVIFDALAAVDQDKQLTWRHVRKLLTTARSWRGLVASPLIFLTVFMGVGSNPLSVPFVLLAFQNGFFWKSVMSRLLGQQDAKPA